MKKLFFLIPLMISTMAMAQTHKIVYLRKIKIIDTAKMASKDFEKILS